MGYEGFDLRPSMYRATPVCHFEGSSTANQAKEIATARMVKNIVMFGLKQFQVRCFVSTRVWG